MRGEAGRKGEEGTTPQRHTTTPQRGQVLPFAYAVPHSDPRPPPIAGDLRSQRDITMLPDETFNPNGSSATPHHGARLHPDPARQQRHGTGRRADRPRAAGPEPPARAGAVAAAGPEPEHGQRLRRLHLPDLNAFGELSESFDKRVADRAQAVLGQPLAADELDEVARVWPTKPATRPPRFTTSSAGSPRSRAAESGGSM
jgi:hypothetical protein